MKKERWQDLIHLIVFLLGGWIIVSPWIIPHAMRGEYSNYIEFAFSNMYPLRGVGATPGAMWNMDLVGVLIAASAAFTLVTYRAWTEWLNIAFGGWLLISSWIFAFGSESALTWNSALVGAAVIFLSSCALATAVIK